MGLLVEGAPLAWPDSIEHHQYVKEHGLIQFLHTYKRACLRRRDAFFWGDEVEMMMVVVGGEGSTRTVKLDLGGGTTLNRARAILQRIRETTSDNLANAAFLPEYGCYMIEGTPARPYGGFTSDLRLVETNMNLRRRIVQQLLGPQQRVLTIGAFPLMGTTTIGNGQEQASFTEPAHAVNGPAAQSRFLPDAILSAHPRFATLTANIRQRRGEKVCITMPLLQDKHTAAWLAAHKAEIETEESRRGLYDPTRDIYMDAMGFGMGSSCLQVTFQARNLGEARRLYDQLAVVAPIMMAVAAACPFWRGQVADTDCRWQVISQSVDDRTQTERAPRTAGEKAAQLLARRKVRTFDVRRRADGFYDSVEVAGDNAPRSRHIKAADTTNASSSLSSSSSSSSSSFVPLSEPLSRSPTHDAGPQPGEVTRVRLSGNVTDAHIAKSRYDSASCYIAMDKRNKAEYGDIDCKYDEAAFARLLAGGIDPLLARHIAHLFIRDPLVIYGHPHLHQDDSKSTDHFENIQSTNWQSVRFKPPPYNADPEKQMGWRVEFRTMGVQITDFENAAYTVFVALLSRTILFFDLNLYMPLSLVDENMKRAHAKNAVNEQKFHFRTVVKTCREDDAVAAEMRVDKDFARVVGSATQQTTKRVANDAALADVLNALLASSATSASSTTSASAAATASTVGLLGDDAELIARLVDGVVGAVPATPTNAVNEHDTPVRPQRAHRLSFAFDCGSKSDKVEEMTMREIFMGKPPEFTGLLPLVRAYLDIIKCDAETRVVVDRYMLLIEKRACGELMTTAQWMRAFVNVHPDYKHDSQLSQTTVTDLLEAIDKLANQQLDSVPQLLGDLMRAPVSRSQTPTENPFMSQPSPLLTARKTPVGSGGDSSADGGATTSAMMGDTIDAAATPVEMVGDSKHLGASVARDVLVHNGRAFRLDLAEEGACAKLQEALNAHLKTQR